RGVSCRSTPEISPPVWPRAVFGNAAVLGRRTTLARISAAPGWCYRSRMTTLADPAPARVAREQYFALVDQGVLTEDDHVELLEGVIVAMPPEGPQHAEVGELVADALRAAIGDRARVRTGRPFDASRRAQIADPDLRPPLP